MIISSTESIRAALPSVVVEYNDRQLQISHRITWLHCLGLVGVPLIGALVGTDVANILGASPVVGIVGSVTGALVGPIMYLMRIRKPHRLLELRDGRVFSNPQTSELWEWAMRRVSSQSKLRPRTVNIAPADTAKVVVGQFSLWHGVSVQPEEETQAAKGMLWYSSSRREAEQFAEIVRDFLGRRGDEAIWPPAPALREA